MPKQITEDVDNGQKIVADGNALARMFYRRMGYERPDGYRFDKATHPQERMCWAMACDAVEHLFGTDLEEVLAELEEA